MGFTGFAQHLEFFVDLLECLTVTNEGISDFLECCSGEKDAFATSVRVREDGIEGVRSALGVKESLDCLGSLILELSRQNKRFHLCVMQRMHVHVV